MDQIKAIIHINGYFVTEEKEGGGGEITYFPREISIASVRYPDEVYTILIQDDDFKVQGEEMYLGQMLKSSLPKNARLMTNVCSLMHIPRRVRHHIERMKEDFPKSTPFHVAVWGIHNFNFVKTVCNISHVYDIYSEILNKRQLLPALQMYIQKHHEQPYYHDYVHEDENVQNCSTRVAWWHARFCQHYNLMMTCQSTLSNCNQDEL